MEGKELILNNKELDFVDNFMKENKIEKGYGRELLLIAFLNEYKHKITFN